MRKDLSTKNGSMTKIIGDHYEEICSISSKDEMISCVRNLFVENGLNTKASNRLLMNMSKQPNVTMCKFVVTNSYLDGCGLGVGDL